MLLQQQWIVLYILLVILYITISFVIFLYIPVLCPVDKTTTNVHIDFLINNEQFCIFSFHTSNAIRKKALYENIALINDKINAYTWMVNNRSNLYRFKNRNDINDFYH